MKAELLLLAKGSGQEENEDVEMYTRAPEPHIVPRVCTKTSEQDKMR